MNYHTLLHSPIVPSKTVPLIDKASQNNAPVLILGEKGTGKELVAKIIHHTGEWESHRFYKIDCAFLKEAAFEEQISRLAKGAREGSIRGSVFLKEIGFLDPPSQFKLLDVMENGVFQLGSEGDIAKHLRFISSSSENLKAKVVQGKFMEDLYERLNTLLIPIPSLRERTGEIPTIAAYLLAEHSTHMKIKKVGISPDALTLLASYWWPGNLKEFESVILRSAVLSESENLTARDLVSGVQSEKHSFLTFVKKTKLGNASPKGKTPPDDPHAPPLPLFFIELVHRIRNPLVSIKTFTQLLREKFNDAEYRDYFYRIVTEDIEKIDSVLNGLLNYIKINTPISKTNTVHLILEEILRKRENQIKERRIKIFKKLEKELPETIVHDEQLRYVLDTLLQYALSSILPDGSIGFLTKSIDLPRAVMDAQTVTEREDRCLEILIVFTGYRTSAERFETVLGISPFQQDDSIELELRLVREIIEKNRGAMKLEVNETKTRTLISLRLPVERRKVVYYPETHPQER
ncbi:MAG: sigma 54-interacting transcriptional regulator [Deltaproteobacteria bacterium]